VKDAAGCVHLEGKIGSTRRELDAWVRTLPQPRTMAMEATIFTGWIYDHLLPHAAAVKVAHPLMLRAIAAAKKKNDRIDARQCVWQVFLAQLWKLTLAHLWQVAGQRRGMEMRCASGWSVAEARSTAGASITP
jgi:hypothetical protein